MSDLKLGSIVVTKKIEQKFPNGRLSYSAKKNQEFIVLLLSIGEKKEQIDMDYIKATLENLGWVLFDKVQKHFGEKATKEFIEKVEKGEL